MKEDDPLDSLLREWKAPEPTEELDRRVTSAYRFAMRPSVWQRCWRMRVSIPLPVLVPAALAMLALFFWLGFSSTIRIDPPVPAAAQPVPPVSFADFQAVQQLEPHIVKEGQ